MIDSGPVGSTSDERAAHQKASVLEKGITVYMVLAWRAGTTILSVVQARQATWPEASNPRSRFLGSINVYKYGLWTCTISVDIRENRDETGLVCLPTQLERTLQLYWCR